MEDACRCYTGTCVVPYLRRTKPIQRLAQWPHGAIHCSHQTAKRASLLQGRSQQPACLLFCRVNPQNNACRCRRGNEELKSPHLHKTNFNSASLHSLQRLRLCSAAGPSLPLALVSCSITLCARCCSFCSPLLPLSSCSASRRTANHASQLSTLRLNGCICCASVALPWLRIGEHVSWLGTARHCPYTAANSTLR